MEIMLKQRLDAASTTRNHAVGERVVVERSGVRCEYVYLQADGARQLGATSILLDGKKAKQPATNYLTRTYVCNDQVAIPDASYGWFLVEGDSLGTRVDAEDPNIAIGNYLIAVNTSDDLVKDVGASPTNRVIALEAAVANNVLIKARFAGDL